jgi:hypothetical protein
MEGTTAMTTHPQLRGMHTLFMGDRLDVSTDGGFVRLHAFRTDSRDRATLTPDQADELARDLMAYAQQARSERVR